MPIFACVKLNNKKGTTVNASDLQCIISNFGGKKKEIALNLVVYLWVSSRSKEGNNKIEDIMTGLFGRRVQDNTSRHKLGLLFVVKLKM